MSAPRTSRAGFTMVEMTVSMVVFAIVIAGASSVLVNQSEFHRDAGAMMEVRNQLRQAATIIPQDLRSLSTTGGDLIVMKDSAIAFRSTFGSSVACVVTGGGVNTITVPPTSIANGRIFTSWSSAPAAEDSMIVYDEGAATTQGDDTWKAYKISTVASAAASSNCASTTGFTAAGDATKTSYKFTSYSTLSTTIVAGAPIRFVRRVRYSLYKAADNLWYLGYCTGTCANASDRTAIAGPLRAYSATASGMTIEYLTTAGAATTVATSVGRIRITLRGQTTEKIQLSGAARTFTDSLQITVAIRNR